MADAAASRRVIVFGSLPPEGTDLDLLVRAPEQQAIRAALGNAGFAGNGSRLVRFAGGSGFEVELAAPAELGLGADETKALFEQAEALPGYQSLSIPASRDRHQLARAKSSGPRLRRLARRWRRPPVIALSGIDGSGKSSQAEALAAALRDLGFAVEVVWMPLASNAWLRRLAVPMTSALARWRGFRPTATDPALSQGRAPNPGSVLRRRSRAANYAWAVLVAFANGISHRSQVERRRLTGGVVIFDRYVLDSAARLRFFYGESRPLRLPRALIRLLSPRPRAAFFLEIPADASIARKADGWTPAELEAQARLYREELPGSDAILLDGRRPPENLAAEIAARTWRVLRPSG